LGVREARGGAVRLGARDPGEAGEQIHMEPTALETFLYFWDDRDGPWWQGWWLTPDSIGSDSFLAFSQGTAATPDCCREWKGGAGAIIDMSVVMIADNVVGIRAAGLGFEGAFELDRSQVHAHGGRPVYRRQRDLTPEEASSIDELAAYVIYSSGSSLTDLSSSGAVVGLPVAVASDTTQRALNWVNGDGEAAEEVAGPLLRHALHVESEADLEAEICKGADARVSLPGLADEDSPLPMGWVVAEASNEPITRSVRGFLLTAASDLETELPEHIRCLPQVVELAAKLRKLVEERGFTLCVWGS
jgi:hypothetical protein